MDFLPAQLLLGDDYEDKSIELPPGSGLPEGRYDFVDFYCTDRRCDCRKTIFQIQHDGKHVSTVNYGWEKPEFYCKWMKAGMDDDMAKDMSGLTVDITSPDRLPREAILRLMQTLMDDTWISTLKNHYKLIRQPKRVDNLIPFPKARSRNAPCPCGSGK